MKYRRLTDLSDEEIIEMIKGAIASVDAVRAITRDKKYQKVSCEIHFEGMKYDDGTLYWDDLEINMDYNDENHFTHDYGLDDKEILRIQQYLIAKGVHPLFKNNPYLQGD